MDISKFKTETVSEMEWIHPHDGPTGVFFSVASRGSPEFDAAHRRHMKRLASLEKRFRTIDRVPPEEQKASVVRFVSEIVAGWRGLEEDGATLPFSAQRMTELLVDNPFLTNEIIDFATEEGNFMPSSSSAS